MSSNDQNDKPPSSDANMAPPPNRPADRLMNDSTMPPPRYADATINKSAKVPAVNPRHRFGLHDWKKLLAVSTDLAQRKGQPIRRDMTVEEVRLHDKNHDGWIILRGRVYNIGPYLPYHPGGVSIFKNLLGKDATSMFDKYHRWVNIDGLIGPLLLGFLATPPKTTNPFSVVPPKESHLANAPRVSAQAVSGSSLLLADDDDDDMDEDQDHGNILPSVQETTGN
jgi:cytochrome b involved in lipid metabolism